MEWSIRIILKSSSSFFFLSFFIPFSIYFLLHEACLYRHVVTKSQSRHTMTSPVSRVSVTCLRVSSLAMQSRKAIMIIVLSLRKVFIILPRFDLPGSISFPSYISLNARIALSLFLPPAISDLLHLCNLTVIFMKIRHGFCDFSTKLYLFRVCVRNCDIKNTFNPPHPLSMFHRLAAIICLIVYQPRFYSALLFMLYDHDSCFVSSYISRFIEYYLLLFFLNIRLREIYVD